MAELTATLAVEGEFPSASATEEIYRWVLVEPVPAGGLWRFRRKPARSTSIHFRLVDLPGESFAGGAHEAASPREEVIDTLEQAKGIIFCYDPIREHDDGDTFGYLHEVLIRLSRRMLADDRLPADGWLPHYVAVCVTKFDDVRVTETAARLNMLSVDPDDPHGVPRVRDDNAADLFERITEISASGNGRMVPTVFNRYFHPDRVRYFVTSSIGFYLDQARGTFDPEDFQNIVPGDQGFRIRGQVYPINVAEPFIWLIKMTQRAT
ncbi:hypothetical protein AB0395_46315 [Streptosporangium sp. NPDC051023]|uniref:hypothetical protein n=1 Tax=Streptosporangium sp. NPDC051023 TaxID=3155410 RepID=UPI00344F28C7